MLKTKKALESLRFLTSPFIKEGFRLIRSRCGIDLYIDEVNFLVWPSWISGMAMCLRKICNGETVHPYNWAPQGYGKELSMYRSDRGVLLMVQENGIHKAVDFTIEEAEALATYLEVTA